MRSSAAARGSRATIVAVVLLLILVAGSVARRDDAVAFGAEASPPPGPVIATGDPRSEGLGPGLIGSPLVILLGVIGLGLATAGVTVVVARVTRRD